MQKLINDSAVSLYEEFNNQFTLEQLSLRTKIPRATLYRRIGSKDTLLKELSKQGLIELNQEADIKSRIFKATGQVVTEYGFISCTMEQIAKEAGLGIATLYRHFSEKEKLLLAFSIELHKQINISTIANKPEGNFEEGLTLLIYNLLSFMTKNAKFMQLIFFGAPAEKKYMDNIRSSSVSTFSIISDYLKYFQKKGAITSSLQIEDMSNALIGLILHFSITAPQHFKRELEAKRDSEIILKLFCEGICISNNKEHNK